MRSHALLAMVMLSFAWTGCDDDESGGADVAGDVSDASDTGGNADSAADADARGDSGGDAGGDADAADSGQQDSADAAEEVEDVADTAGDAPVCDYLDIEVVLLECGEDLEFLTRFQDLNGTSTACPDYWSFDSGLARYTGIEEAADARECSADCVWAPAAAVMFLHCGHRDEYISYEDIQDRSCDTLYQFQTGFHDGLQGYRDENPCECGDNQFLLEWPTSGYVIDYIANEQNGFLWVTSTEGIAAIENFVDGTTETLATPGGPTEDVPNDHFNPGYSYRLVPGSVTFDDEWPETCDATPCHVEEGWADWEVSPNTWCPSDFRPVEIFDCTDGDGTFCESVWIPE